MKKGLSLLYLGLLLFTICDASKRKANDDCLPQKVTSKPQTQLRPSTNTKPVINNQNAAFKKIAYVNVGSSWWGPSILDSLGINSKCYNIIILTFWIPETGDYDMVKLWANIHYYLNTDKFGSSNAEVQKYILDKMHANGKQLFISAFGGTSNPRGDPIAVAKQLASFINQNPYIDGVDLDYEDNEAVYEGYGIDYIIEFQKTLSANVNNKKLLFTHAPQAPYFSRQYYNDKGYYKVEKEIGHLIAWYNIQFYNQGPTTYDSYESLFIKSQAPFVGTSIKEIIELAGIPIQKIVLGKPATPRDAANTGYVAPSKLGEICLQAKKKLGYTLPGFFIWQYPNDKECKFANAFEKSYFPKRQ